jgi:hypothetical protein
MQSSPAFCYFLPLRSKYSPQHPVFKYPQIYVLPLVWETKFHTHTKHCVPKLVKIPVHHWLHTVD